MRNLIVLTLLVPSLALAQQSPPQAQNDPYTSPPPGAQQPLPPPSSPYAQPPGVVIAPPLPPPTGLPPPSGTNDPMMLRMHAVQSAHAQWTGARVMNGFAGVIGIVSTGLSLSNTIYVLAAHYPPSVTDFTKPPSPSDPAQALSYVSSTSAAFAFGLSAGSLGWRHHILKMLDADPGRGLFWAGTITGLVGIASIVASYAVGFSNMSDPRNQSIAVLATSLGGSMISNVGTAMLASDATHLQKVWKSLSTF